MHCIWHNPAGGGPASAAPASASTTHGWAEVYLFPGPAGSRSIRPTAASAAPICCGCDRAGHQARDQIPVAGSFSGMSNAFEAMSVEMVVREALD
jgi:hypothetical protein